MGRLSKGCLALAAAAAAAAIGTNVYAAEPTYDELKQQLDQLKSRLDQLETRQAVSAQEVDKTVERVLQDANHRSQLLQAEG
ncbi:MAG TPA: hypothetical protein VHD56_06975, partial [Tepidisphaeraceae bacterium]|nr:hypothetical protein [Tepidisphaeraceae bacterium]